MSRFNNSVIEEPVPGKPHIILIDGWWRVSSVKYKSYKPYVLAHKFIGRLNKLNKIDQ